MHIISLFSFLDSGWHIRVVFLWATMAYLYMATGYIPQKAKILLNPLKFHIIWFSLSFIKTDFNLSLSTLSGSQTAVLCNVAQHQLCHASCKGSDFIDSLELNRTVIFLEKLPNILSLKIYVIKILRSILVLDNHRKVIL